MFRVLPIAALVLLSACNKQAAEEANEMSANEVAAQLASVKIDPGQWESVTQIVSVTGPLPKEAMQRMVGQRNTVSNCITPEQAARPSANFLAAQQNSDCTYQDFRMQGGRLSGRMTCSGGNLPGEMVTAMNGAYGPKSYDMTMDMETADLPGGVSMKIKARTQGRRVGECS
ncbi:MAG TPA: DUF3617 domain-containing protein [Allosphingosinicella sp.]|uniref:DUF3617 domain-containing protein n=1 Tax=Allosphingosinicella sp. TaxID=2823234 RepID=UPI002EDA85B0